MAVQIGGISFTSYEDALNLYEKHMVGVISSMDAEYKKSSGCSHAWSLLNMQLTGIKKTIASIKDMIKMRDQMQGDVAQTTGGHNVRKENPQEVRVRGVRVFDANIMEE